MNQEQIGTPQPNKAYLTKTTVNITLNDGRLGVFPLKIRKETKVSTLPTSIQSHAGGFNQENIMKEKEMKASILETEEVNYL